MQNAAARREKFRSLRSRARAAAGAAALGAAAFAPAALLAQGIEPPPGAPPPAFAKATAEFVAGKYAECQSGFAALARATGRAGLSARAAYGAACCAAQLGRADAAFGELGLALANGFHDVARALADPRLEPLHGDRRWLSFLRQVETLRTARERMLEPTLLALWSELEAEKSGERPIATPERAAARRAQALERVDHGKLKEPEDFFHAADLLAESERPEEVARARALAHSALGIDPDLVAARAVYAQALDRELLLAGKPQKFGTQLVERDGQWKLYEIDPAVTDADRVAWGVPPLSELEARRPPPRSVTPDD